LDLEDSVAASEKKQALNNVIKALETVILDNWRAIDGRVEGKTSFGRGGSSN
jgi:citrate lyase beta subunit